MSRTISIDRFLTKSEDWIPVKPDEQYKQITARLWGKGLTLRGEVPGSAIAAAATARVARSLSGASERIMPSTACATTATAATLRPCSQALPPAPPIAATPLSRRCR